MQKKTSNLGLFSGLPPIPSKEAALAQWKRGPQLLGPSLATPMVKMVQRTGATKVQKPSESNPDG